MKTTIFYLLAFAVCGVAFAADEPAKCEARLPVREVSAFKDGMAVVVCEGVRPVDAAGNVVLDELPQPILGAFWPYSTEPGIALASATSACRPVSRERDTTNVRDLLEANIGALVRITEDNGAPFAGKILRLCGGGDDANGLVLLSSELGVKVQSIGRIRDMTFDGEPKTKLPLKAQANQLILRPAWPEGKAAAEAKVGMMYVQKGFRWIPEYRVELNENGTAHIRLQATLVNDLVDLEDTTVHLIVGVPSFVFKDNLDPMALQEAIAEVARSVPQQALLSNGINMSNVMMTQVATPVPMPADAQGEPLPGEDKGEDLYTFTVPHVTLAKGERMTVPVAEYDLPYENVYRLDVPLSAPQELRQAMTQAGPEQLVRLPKVMHAVRLTNTGSIPLTTAPALILRGGMVLAQSTMTYAPSKARVDLDLTSAVDIQVAQEDREVKRTPNALHLQDTNYQQIDIEGKLRLSSYRAEAVTVEVTRYVSGQVDSAGADGKFDQLNASSSPDWPTLADWYRWPYWWQNLNGVGRIVWTAKIETGKSIELPYAWHYFSR